MKLNINNEFGPLKSAVVCWGTSMPKYGAYKSDDPEFLKYHTYSWDKDLLLKQQEKYFKLLEKYNVKLVFPNTDSQLFQQMYTRDTGFVVGDKLYYSKRRKFSVRNGEIDKLLEVLNLTLGQKVPLEDEIEGGDALVVDKNNIYVGLGSRTSIETIDNLQTRTFELGENVMHLDTRLTLLPKKIAMVNINAFTKEDLNFINSNYQIIEVTDEEAIKLGTNALAINPETIVVPKQHHRIGQELKAEGLKVEIIDYSEPINLGGSFRCTTLPLARSN